jgi:hypothetical protein
VHQAFLLPTRQQSQAPLPCPAYPNEQIRLYMNNIINMFNVIHMKKRFNRIHVITKNNENNIINNNTRLTIITVIIIIMRFNNNNGLNEIHRVMLNNYKTVININNKKTMFNINSVIK